MTTSTAAIHHAITSAMAAGQIPPTPGADPTTDAPGGLGALAGVAGMSPVLAGAYLAYLVIRMLIPAVLIFCTIRVVPASQRSALLQAYLVDATDPSAAAVKQISARPARGR